MDTDANDVDLSSVNIRVAGIIKESIVDGPGIRFSIFTQGCPHICDGCHNPDTHDFEGGNDMSAALLLADIEKDPLLSGVTFSGGEPFCQSKAVYELAVKVKGLGLNIMAYSGWTLEQLLEMSEDDKYIGLLLEQIDYLVDGRFILSERDLELRFRGSRNQRYIDMNKTRETGIVTVIE